MTSTSTNKVPVVSVSTDSRNVREGDQLRWNFNLTQAAPAGGLIVEFALTQDSDPLPGDIQYNVAGGTNITSFELLRNSAGVITGAKVGIAAGATAASLVNNIIADNLTEGPESVTYTLINGTGYAVNPTRNAAQFTILNTSTTPVVSVSTDSRNVREGDQLRWNFNLTQPAPTNGLIVEFALTQDSDPLPGDIQYNVAGGTNITSFELLRNSAGVITGAKVGIAAGATAASLVNNIIADNLREGPESVTYTLINGTGYAVNPTRNAAQFTILDTSTTPVVSVSTDSRNVREGDQLRWNFNLTQPAPTNGLIVEFALTQDSDPLPGDIQYNVAGGTNITSFELLRNSAGVITGAKVGIAAGATAASLVNNIIADNLTEGTEIVTYTLISGIGYGANLTRNAAQFTILDTSTSPVVSVSTDSRNVTEGDQLRWNFNLTQAAPAGGLIVEFALTQDTDPLPGDIQYNVAGGTNITSFELLRNSADIITGAKVGIAAGATAASLVNNIIADNLTEGREIVTYTLISGIGYGANPTRNAAEFTILDTSTTPVGFGTEYNFGGDNLTTIPQPFL
ncbi:hypothetical protein [Nostoc sphaeroides]|uniref:Uncharacterized protein n=1 Tax=Nostoc sphaeroides CCNUC1 TaxID=2653204 RepID=A0A5P8W8Q4_9NOSO|nr:hypothetical protein [Nostoc sphaeroides]QFS49163.1 hypothetical protein GXM_06657 [Nostoc sphaeroides CCNUC1]